MKKIIPFFAVLLFSLRLSAGDTLKVMSYNLLNYGNITSYCTASNNSFVDKEKYLRRIINYVKPDIFAVCELAGNSFIQKRLLDSALNGGIRPVFAKANYSNSAGSDIVVMLYYNAVKLSLAGQYVLNTQVRDIVLYRLYYRDPNLSQTHDTAFVNCIVAHLKAGSTTSDANTRKAMVNNAMLWLSQHGGAGNYLFMGDLNVKRSSEQAYQLLVNNSNSAIRFYDPINKPGNWNNSSSFAPQHTQSTHTSSNGCASGGGLDDRFDFILASNDIINGTKHVKYIPGSYAVVGNDGAHFNQAINSGNNGSAPASVINDLYHMSDHLPVVLLLQTDKQGAGIQASVNPYNLKIRTVNPVYDKLTLSIDILKPSSAQIEIISLAGQKLISMKRALPQGNTSLKIDMSTFGSGLYFLRVKDESGYVVSRKIVKL